MRKVWLTAYELDIQLEMFQIGPHNLLAAASHELRQPVHALVLLIEALRQQQQRPPDTAEATRQDLFNNLMDLSRLESGHHPVQPVDVHPAALLTQVHDRHRAEAQQKGLTLRLRISTAAHAVWVHTDRVMLERCRVNLLSNALRYTDHGEVRLTLRTRPNGALVLSVVDSGVDMGVADQQRIFDPYGGLVARFVVGRSAPADQRR